MSTIPVVERLIPIMLFKATVYHGVRDRTEEGNAEALRLLDEAIAWEVAELTRPQQESAKRHAMKAEGYILAPFIAQNMDCAKFALALIHALNVLIDDYGYERCNPAFEEALGFIFEGNVPELAEIERLNASAERIARRVISAMQGLGYFVGRDAA